MSRRALWLVLLGLTLPLVAGAQEPGMGGGMGGMGGGFGGHGDRGGWGGGRRGQGPPGEEAKPVWEQLGLNRDQREKVQEILSDQEKASAQDRADLRQARMDLEKMTQADEPDRDAIEKQIDKIEEIQAALQKSSTWAMLDARKLLTPPQKKRLDQLLAERMRGGGRDMGPPGAGLGGGEEGGPGGGR
jgi:Spy/CpxP family protein refolding chaperone